MQHELVIRGGTVIDGTGSQPVDADVAVDDGVITAIGRDLGTGVQEIDATGAIVTPGFIDLHTHFDAQVGWDPYLTPSSLHGVTTAMIGNCGMAFAPVRSDGHDALAGMMEAVEDIPAAAIRAGLPWDWETYGQYLDTVERLEPSINIAGLAGHSPLRYYVMGDRAVDDHPLPGERDHMASVIAEAMDAGAAGFSTSRFLGHRLPDGRHVPGTFAERDELQAIARAMGGRGLFQVVVNTDEFRAEIDLLRDLARAGARVLLIVGVGDEEKTGASVVRMFEGFEADGLDITGMISPRPGGLVVGLGGSLLPWRTPQWARLHRATQAERLAALANEDTRRALLAEADAGEPFLPAEQIYPLGTGAPAYTAGPDGSLAALAEAAGVSPAALFVRLSLESMGRAYFTARLFNRSTAAIGEALRSHLVMPGLGDAGAHVGQVMDAGWTTFWLTHWVRDTGTFDLAEGIRRVTSFPASVLGIADRGRLAPGLRADVNVIDLARLASGPIEFAHDLPGGAGRFTQGATGYRATLVNGSVMVRDDEHTTARAGQVLRRFDA
jgi:N-acyl-D-amino-acid deacylase